MRQSSLRSFVVLSSGDWFHVTWINATLHKAEMVNVETDWDRSNELLVCPAMRSDKLLTVPEDPVAAALQSSRP
jgi:hypothetical protein